jgi:hypothetical protein
LVAVSVSKYSFKEDFLALFESRFDELYIRHVRDMLNYLEGVFDYVSQRKVGFVYFKSVVFNLGEV